MNSNEQLRILAIFHYVIGVINCLMVPFGTALGVFDIVLLTRDDIRSQYDAAGG